MSTPSASTPTTDGSDLTDVYGPLHAVQLANGTPGSYRRHTHNFYGTGIQAHLLTSRYRSVVAS